MASSKNTGLTLTLIFFVITTLVFGVVAIMMWQDNQEGAAQWQADKEKFQKADQDLKLATADIATLKQLIGIDYAEIGGPDADPQEESVAGALLDEMQKNAGNLQQKTVSATLEKMHTEIVELRGQLADRQKALADLQVKYDSLDDIQLAMRNETDEARKEAERTREEIQTTKETELSRKDELLAKQRDELNKLSGERDEAVANRDALKVQLEERIQRQQNLNRHLAEQLKDLKNDIWEVPDGRVVWTSRDKKTVYIDLGSSDRIPSRITFSVYKKRNNGVARGEEDIKASIEVTKILGPHKAEARVLNANLFTPIAKGDPIYTPLWSPGRSETFALVGFIDLDGDGKSDRKQLRDKITATGAVVVAEIFDDGTTFPADADFSDLINTDVKFVVKGDMPSPEDTSVPEEKRQITDVLNHYKVMRDSALDNGVAIVSLNDFLSYIGFKVERRLYRPGEDRPYTLKNGSRSAAVDDKISRVGGGNSTNAALYQRNPSLRKRSSTGTTSGRYGTR